MARGSRVHGSKRPMSSGPIEDTRKHKHKHRGKIPGKPADQPEDQHKGGSSYLKSGRTWNKEIEETINGVTTRNPNR